jgi:hypothetical protein
MRNQRGRAMPIKSPTTAKHNATTSSSENVAAFALKPTCVPRDQNSKATLSALIETNPIAAPISPDFNLEVTTSSLSG